MPSCRQLRRLGIRTGANRKGLSWPVATRWVLRRQEVFETWMASGCNGAEAARRLGCSKQTVYKILRRHLDGLDLTRQAQVEEEERLARRRDRQALCARRRRAERKRAKNAGGSGDASWPPEKAHPEPEEGGHRRPSLSITSEIADVYF